MCPTTRRSLIPDVKGMKLGVPEEFFAQGVEPAVADAVRAAIDQLVALGAIAEEVSMPHAEYALPTYYILAPAEASFQPRPLRRRPLRPPHGPRDQPH